MRLISDVSDQKLRGGFYTPDKIADFILKWAFNGKTNVDLLEPSCGDGVFIERVKQGGYEYNSFTAVELDKCEAEKSQKIGLPNLEVLNCDFHSFCINTDRKFDLIIGNPPYIRYQYFDKSQQFFASSIFSRAHLTYSKLTNAWVSFVVGSSLLLKESGKIGFVVPAEILQVSFAKQLREFLSSYYNIINIVSFEKLVFPDIQQEVVLLLCEKNMTNKHSIEHLEVANANELENVDLYKLSSSQKKIDNRTNKWTFYFLEQKEIDFLEELQSTNVVPRISQYAKIEVGITTGSNDFFTVPFSVVEEYNLEKYAKPLVGRSIQVSGAIFSDDDWEVNKLKNLKAHLLTFPTFSSLNKGAKEYIKWGVEQRINQGYKCKIRDEWHIVPSLRVSDAFFMRRNNLYPKLVINEANAYSTDTMHRVTMKSDLNIKSFVASYYNSLSLASSEIFGRSHGGGVLELMPSEAEDIFLPFHEENSDLLIYIDKMLRDKVDILKILEVTNEQILIKKYGFSLYDVKLAHSIWSKLSQRRIHRN